jgi:hypothetical protein
MQQIYHFIEVEEEKRAAAAEPPAETAPVEVEKTRSAFDDFFGWK